MKFFNDNVLLSGKWAKKLYQSVKGLPIIDYHCHLDQKKIAKDEGFTDIGELWLGGDHYKWRAMRINGVDEYYITGGASYKEKFLKYAEIVPNLIGNPLYYWTHLELKQIFGINKPLNKDTAEEIYNKANEKLKELSVLKLLEFFGIEFIATTDDPVDDLAFHGKYGSVNVTPTFRPDKVFALNNDYLSALAVASGVEINTLDDMLKALELRLDFFVSKGAKFSDIGFDKFPKAYASLEEARSIFINRENLTDSDKDAFFGFMLVFLAKAYAKRNVTMQIHFGVERNVNEAGFKASGADSGYDVISSPTDSLDLVNYLKRLPEGEFPKIVLYTLNDATLASLANVSGAYRNVLMGAAWWFNDTVEGIKKNLSIISEYSALGVNLGMLTDSRSFSSYSRFDFFRRILCSFVGKFVDSGEYDYASAETLVKNICYNNVKGLI